jgi:hypothetical protein
MTTWSYSSLELFEQCPRRYKMVRITKEVVEQNTEVRQAGNEVHKAIELAIKGEQILPLKYKQFAPIVARCAQAPGEKLVELKWAVSESFKPTTYFAKDVWCRGVIDFGVVHDKTAALVDWKTGKPKADLDQLKLFAAALFAHRPVVQKVRTAFAWLAHAKLDRDVFTREQVPELWGSFLPRVARISAAERRDDFPPKPSGLCKAHCPVPRSKCEFSGRS